MIAPSPRATVLYLSAALLVAVVVATIFFLPEMAVAYYQGPGGNALRQRLGFELKPVSVHVLDSVKEVWCFTNVRAGGPLALAGVRDGDAWVEAVFRGCAMDQRPEAVRVYELLAGTGREPVRFKVIHGSEVAGAWWKQVREVSLPASR